MVLGGGSLVMPILMALERFGSKTISSLFFTFSCCFCTLEIKERQPFVNSCTSYDRSLSPYYEEKFAPMRLLRVG